EVTAALNENCSLGILDGDDVLYVARSTARRIVHGMQVAIGTRLPAAVSGMGRVLLAHLPEAALAESLRRQPPPRLTPATIVDPQALRRVLEAVRRDGFALVE